MIIITKLSPLFFIFGKLKRVISILFLSAYLFSFTELHQLLKIPVLIEHFHEHRQEENSISFWSFLRMHYLEKIVVDKDYQRDQQLPMRDADCGMMTVSNLYECQHIAVEISLPSERTREFTFYDEFSKPRFAAYDIFQPPRIS